MNLFHQQLEQILDELITKHHNASIYGDSFDRTVIAPVARAVAAIDILIRTEVIGDNVIPNMTNDRLHTIQRGQNRLREHQRQVLEDTNKESE